MNKEQSGYKCNIYITEEDYKDKKPFATVISNINPVIVEFFNEEDPEHGKTTVYWDAFGDSDLTEKYSNGLDIVISTLGEYSWEYTMLTREEYLSIVPKKVIQYGNDYYIE